MVLVHDEQVIRYGFSFGSVILLYCSFYLSFHPKFNVIDAVLKFEIVIPVLEVILQSIPMRYDQLDIVIYFMSYTI